jgi:hypothetical protein
MQQTFIALMRCPGGENEGGGTDPKNNEVKPDDQQSDTADIPKKKGLLSKLKEALKDWSNDDQLDQQIDDATP